MNEMKDILTLEDVKRLVDVFYEKVRANDMLAPVFNERIQNRWPEHLEKMYTFWQTILLEERTYFGSPFPAHAQPPVSHIHFEQWMQLFTQTVDELFAGEIAKEAKWRAGKMAEMFEYKIEQFRKTGFKNLV